MLTGDGPTSLEIQSMLKRLPYIVLYLTRAGITESSPELADVLYQVGTQNVTLAFGTHFGCCSADLYADED